MIIRKVRWRKFKESEVSLIVQISFILLMFALAFISVWFLFALFVFTLFLARRTRPYFKYYKINEVKK